MVKNLFMFFSLIFLYNSCRQIKRCDNKEQFTFTKTPYNGSEIRTDGYYYGNGFPKFFFSNGVLIKGSYLYSQSDIVSVESKVISGEFYEDIKNRTDHWSLFVINGNEIKYEYFLTKGPLDCYYSRIATGVILNDTTIQFTQLVNADGTEALEIDDIWHFKQFSPKPDSTGTFIP